MKIVIVGYGEMFRALITGVLTTSHEVVGVFRYERVKYDSLKRSINDKFNPSQDYNFINTHNLYEIKAKSVNSKKFRDEIKKLEADLIIVGSWGEKFSIETINSPKIFCINTHPSLLPKYRGPNPYIHVILNDEIKTGVTFHIMDAGYDSGDILYQTEVNILKEDTGGSLRIRCTDAARKGIALLLNDFKQKYDNRISQNEKESTYNSQVSLSETILDFKKESSLEISKKIRAFMPFLKCYICYKNEFFSFESYKITKKISNKEPGTIVKKIDNALYIVCKDGYIIAFYALKIIRPFSYFFTKLFLKKIIKNNELAE